MASSAIEDVNALRTFVTSSMFWLPEYLAASAWIEHLPFAFWLVDTQRPRRIVELGTHYGTSYFALCQAVAKLGLDTACYAVDTWKGDEHAGFYGEEVYSNVQVYNRARYSSFSTLVRSSFDDALHHFADGSIDLLHIDGHHAYESVRHDFESWRPKLSNEAIVLLHDTNVRERGFGVFNVLDDLKSQYPFFEFIHGHGLGVVGAGRRLNGPIAGLFEAEKDAHTRHALREVFAKLGAACSNAFALQTGLKQREELHARFAEARKKAEAAGAQLSKERQDNAALRQEHEAQRREIAALGTKVAQLELSVAERFRELAVVTRRLAHKEKEGNALAGKLDKLRKKSLRRRFKRLRRRVLKAITGKRRPS